MAVTGPMIDDTREAAADLSAAQFKFVKVDANGKMAAIAAATDKPAGVLQNKPTSGQQCLVAKLGMTKISADAALNEGDSIGPSADGQADAKVEGTDTTEYICGTMRDNPGAAGEIGTAWINCINPHRAA